MRSGHNSLKFLTPDAGSGVCLRLTPPIPSSPIEDPIFKSDVLFTYNLEPFDCFCRLVTWKSLLQNYLSP
jgi:hypothetical protein